MSNEYEKKKKTKNIQSNAVNEKKKEKRMGVFSTVCVVFYDSIRYYN